MPDHAPVRSFADREIARQEHLVHRLKASDSTGRWAYYFIVVKPWRERAFLAAIGGKDDIDLESYGRVIASNYGETASPETLRSLRDRFGWRT